MRSMIDKKTAKKILAFYERQLNSDISFWIKHRPSRWSYYLPDKWRMPFLKFIDQKGRKKFVLIVALIFSLIFVGVIQTLNFIWLNFFRAWLMLLLIPIFYWTMAIICIYTKIIALAFRQVLLFIFAMF